MPFSFLLKPNVNNAYEDKNGDLILLNVQTGDAGAYICKASNSFGTASSVVTLVVHGNSHNLHLTGHLFHCHSIYLISSHPVGTSNSTSTCNKHRIVYE